MNDFENKLGKALSENGTYDSARGRQIIQTTSRGFEKRLRRMERLTWIWHILLGSFLLFLLIHFGQSQDIKEMLGLAVLIIAALSGLVVIKLWYWTMNSKIAVLKEIALLRLQITPESGPDIAKSHQPGWSISLHEAGRSRERIFWYIILFAAMFGSVVLANMVLQTNISDFQGEEIVEWHISNSETVQAHSRLWLNARPEDSYSVPLTLPYAEGSFKSISLDGETLNFIQTGAGEAVVELPPTHPHFINSALEVKWRFPFDALEQDEEGRYRARLRGLVPLQSYMLTIVLEPDSGFEFGDDPSADRMIPFRGKMHKPVRDFGSCGMMIRKTATDSAPNQGALTEQ